MRNVCIAVAVFAALAVQSLRPVRKVDRVRLRWAIFSETGYIAVVVGRGYRCESSERINVKYRYELTDSVGVMASLGSPRRKRAAQ